MTERTFTITLSPRLGSWDEDEAGYIASVLIRDGLAVRFGAVASLQDTGQHQSAAEVMVQRVREWATNTHDAIGGRDPDTVSRGDHAYARAAMTVLAILDGKKEG